MAFLDNSGDIILDAVLTDVGRLRLAKGDGTFKITQFAFGDDEINYALYDKNHPSGSAYYDLEILQTPILEAFTNNTSVLKYQLMSNTRADLLYLPVLSLNTTLVPFYSGLNTYLVTSDVTTANTLTTTPTGWFDGVETVTDASSNIILDEGLNTTQTDKTVSLSTVDSSLYETAYSIEINSKLASIVDENGILLSPSTIDDDGIATYVVSQNPIVRELQVYSTSGDPETTTLLGTRGSRVKFGLRVTNQMQTSTYLFTTLGGTTTIGGTNYYYVDSSVVVKGLTTGVSNTVPVKFIKKV